MSRTILPDNERTVLLNWIKDNPKGTLSKFLKDHPNCPISETTLRRYKLRGAPRSGGKYDPKGKIELVKKFLEEFGEDASYSTFLKENVTSTTMSDVTYYKIRRELLEKEDYKPVAARPYVRRSRPSLYQTIGIVDLNEEQNATVIMNQIIDMINESLSTRIECVVLGNGTMEIRITQK